MNEEQQQGYGHLFIFKVVITVWLSTAKAFKFATVCDVRKKVMVSEQTKRGDVWIMV